MGKIIVDSSPKREMLEALRVSTWPTWSAEESEFPWQYDTTESCLILEVSIALDIMTQTRGARVGGNGKGKRRRVPSHASFQLLQGSAIVTPDAKHGAEEVVIAAGDFCIFPKGLSCTWKVISRISKHYCFE